MAVLKKVVIIIIIKHIGFERRLNGNIKSYSDSLSFPLLFLRLSSWEFVLLSFNSTDGSTPLASSSLKIQQGLKSAVTVSFPSLQKLVIRVHKLPIIIQVSTEFQQVLTTCLPTCVRNMPSSFHGKLWTDISLFGALCAMVLLLYMIFLNVWHDWPHYYYLSFYIYLF